MSEEFIKKESGSGKGTKIILVTRVHKECTDEKMPKLVDEIRFLENIPEKWRVHFPTIVASHISSDNVYYEMPHYSLPTLRRLLFSGTFTHKEALRWIDKILSFAFEMYREEIIKMPDDYMDQMHFGRARRRLQELLRKSEIFKKIVPEHSLKINGRTYGNALPMIHELERAIISSGLNVQPEFVSKWGHFDMHFSNVLIDLERDNFVLIDPRGYPYCDYYYDFGKLWHSVNGKYEFIAENRFTLTEGGFQLEKNDVYWECEKIKQHLPELFKKYSAESLGDIIRKTEFNEAIHFISLVPFILDFDGKDERALVAYYTGVTLLNNFVVKYVKKKD